MKLMSSLLAGAAVLLAGCASDETARQAPQPKEGLAEHRQLFREAYGALKSTLTPHQLQNGANDLAELDAGLDILQEAFDNFREDVTAGQPVPRALRNLCSVLGRGTNLWLQEFSQVCTRLRVALL
jgi:hypothetical protein